MSLFLLTGCAQEKTVTDRTDNQTASVTDILDNAEKTENETPKTSAPQTTDTLQKEPAEEKLPELKPETDSETSECFAQEDVDVDLTQLSATMVYSEVYNIMMHPEEYVGKRMKMSGMYSPFYDPETDTYYFACIIKDATACCAQGIEFEPTADYRYPEDYPQDGDTICVIGVFDTYTENGETYATLRDAKFL